MRSRGDAALVVDIDLAVLAADSASYDAYAAAVRREYASVPDQAFREGRTVVLRGFLERPAIYATPAIHDLRERPARANLRRELQVGGRLQA
jgi:predicted metal-dependent HD superfamily phosphohydrolase